MSFIIKPSILVTQIHPWVMTGEAFSPSASKLSIEPWIPVVQSGDGQHAGPKTVRPRTCVIHAFNSTLTFVGLLMIFTSPQHRRNRACGQNVQP